MSKWKREQQQESAVRYRAPIRFGVSISLPRSGRFEFEEQYTANPEAFLKQWLEGAVSSIYTGPLRNEVGELTGNLIIRPLVRVNHSPHIAQAITNILRRR